MNTRMKQITRSMTMLMAVLLLTATAAVSQKYDRVVKESFQTKNNPTVEVESKFGEVHVSAGSGNTVTAVVKVTAHDRSEAAARKLADAARVEIKGSGDQVTVRVALPEDMKGDDDRGIEIDVRVTLPSESKLDLRSKFGAVHVTGVKGAVKVGTDFGEVTIKECANLDLTSSFGEVSLGGITGSMTVESKMGEVKAYGVPGGKIKSSYGEIDVNRPSGPIDINSSMGEITVKGCRGGTISSSYGEVTLVMDKGFSGRIEAESSFGDIDSDYDLQSKEKKKSYGPTSQKKFGTVGSGSDKLYVKSSFGDISIEKE
ncbi:MAG: DUF4097 family beta strand repeat protein [Bacteroidetes bacterium]|nr:DUF4097 family beta strand repeat protein [Bacteroidota bacterium]